MLKSKIVMIILIPIVLIALVLVQPKRILVSGCTNEPLNYSTRIYIDKTDKVLAKMRYNYSTSMDKRYISVITLDSHTAYVQEYIIEKDGSCDINVPKNTDFIISLPTYSTVAYTWNIKSDLNKTSLQLDNKTKIDIPKPLFESKSDGGGYQRENLYFKSIGNYEEKLVLSYEHIDGVVSENFETTLNFKAN